MKTIAVIQARLGSTRFPGKVLADLGGHPVLEWCVRACRAAPGVDEVWVATTVELRDDEIERWCYRNHVKCYRGSETDVLGRFAGLVDWCKSIEAGPDLVLRITGDEPFIDPQVIGAVVRLQKQTGAAFVTNVSPRTYPDGLDVQAMTVDALMAAHKEATRQLDRDGVCTWIERNRSRFPAETVINPIPGLHGERWVLDTSDDYEFCKAIVARWNWPAGPPTQLDILEILDRNPLLRLINNHSPDQCNERYVSALAEEPIYARTYERSQAQFEKAHAVIPLGAQTFSKSWLQYPQPSPLFLSHGQGGLVWDVDGNEFVDLVSALLPNVLGYRDPDVDSAIRRQLAGGISFSLATELEAQLAETLCRLIPCAEMVRFGKTGSDVTSAAVRLARAHSNREGILIAEGGYHGWHDWAVWGTNRGDYGVPCAIDVRRDSISRPLEMLGDELFPWAAVIVEPNSHPVDQLQELRRVCTETGTVLIFDEVITGFRADLGGAQKLFGVTPDLACFGKAMANGMPLSAVVGRRDIMKLMEPPDNIFYSGTFFGETLSIAAAIATIAKLEREKVIGKLWKTGLSLQMCVSDLIHKLGVGDQIELDGLPPCMQVKFGDSQIEALWRREMIGSGTLITNRHNICAAHGPSEITRVLNSYTHALAVMAEAVRRGDVAERLAGASVGPGVRAS